MNQRAIIIAVVLFVLIVVGMFLFAQMKRAELQREAEPIIQPDVEEPVSADVSRIDAKHFFDDETNRHTLAGEVLMPTPCDLLETNAIVLESFPEQVTVSFNVVNNAETCAQVQTPQRFKVSFEASDEASIEATFKGAPVTLNLIPAGDDEDPDDFELFIKG